MDEIMNKTEYPDSIELGSTKTGKLKVYYNADDLAKAKARVANAIAVKLFGERFFNEEKLTEEAANNLIEEMVEAMKK